MSRLKKFFGIGVVALMLSTWIWSTSRETEKSRSPARAREVPLGHGDPWYGGKPSIPVRVESDVSGAVPAGEWIPVRLKVRADLDCTSLVTRVRAVDAVEVISTDQSLACDAGAPVVHEARVRVLPEGAGLVAVDVEVHGSDGVKQITRAISIHAAPRDSSEGAEADPSP